MNTILKNTCSLLFAGWILVACKTGPDYAKPDIEVPKEWSEARNGGAVDKPVSITAWWTSLNDAPLNGLIARSVNSNFDLRIAEARVREARAARGIAASALFPTVDASGSWTRSQSADQGPLIPNKPSATFGAGVGPSGFSRSINVRNQSLSLNRSVSGGAATTSASVTPGGAGLSADRTANLFQAGFDASWELDIFGGNRRAVEAANADIEASDESRRDVLISVMSEVALNYIELRSAQNRLRITENNIKAQADTVELTQARYKAGLSSELDSIRAQALLATTRSQVPLLQTQIDTAVHRLSVLIGEEPGALKAELQIAAGLPASPAEVPVGLPSDLLRRRPDIRRSERELAASTARIGEARADLFPKFYLTGAFAGQNGTLGSVWNSPNQLWSLGPSISLPIFQGGRIRANIEVQNARQEQAAINYEKSIMTALEDVENGLVSFSKEQERSKFLAEAVRANEESVKLANERYIRGLADFLNVLDAQGALFQSEDQLVQSESSVLMNLISLYKALGGGWEIHEGEQIASTAPGLAKSSK
jgi:multidrug efflux system outer membrane protein